MNDLIPFGGDEAVADRAKTAGMQELSARENEIRLHLLESLAMSQRAIARMIQHCAELPGYSEEMSRQILRNLDLLVRCQGALAEKISGHRLRRCSRGSPGPPWLSGLVASSGKPAQQQAGMGQSAAESVQ